MVILLVLVVASLLVGSVTLARQPGQQRTAAALGASGVMVAIAAVALALLSARRTAEEHARADAPAASAPTAGTRR